MRCKLCFIAIISSCGYQGASAHRDRLCWRREHVQHCKRCHSAFHHCINTIPQQVDAVGKTSVTLSVKQRIAEGLSRAGTSNTLKVVTYNSILGVIAVFSVGAVRQFCVFATVVLVAHWFLAHTFFLAVLSIDIARLEVRMVFCPCSILISTHIC